MVKFRKMLIDNKGFTLIELLVVIAVLGILAAIAIPRLTGVTDKARISQAETALSSMRNAMEMHKVEFNYYPGAFDAGSLTGYQDTVGLTEYLDSTLAQLTPNGWTITVDNDNSTTEFTVTATPDDTDLPTLFVDESTSDIQESS